MSKYSVTTGVQTAPVKTVLYGPEGIGKSTFASHFPDPVFIDTEGGTKRLNVARLPQPTSWAMLLDEVAAGLTEAEVADVMKMVADLKSAGFSIIWIEHVIETMVNSTDHLMCMSDGTQLLIGDPLEVMNSKLVEEVYLGVEEDE